MRPSMEHLLLPGICRERVSFGKLSGQEDKEAKGEKASFRKTGSKEKTYSEMKSGSCLLGRLLIITLLLLLFAFAWSVSAAELEGYGSYDTVAVNSKDWHDVYSGVLLAKLTGADAYFLSNDRVANTVAGRVRGADVLLLEPDSPMYSGFRSILESKGKDVKEYGSDDINLELAGDLSVRGFILVSPTYGYDAMSVAPYAILKDYFVVFADSGNIDEVADAVSGDILLYGNLDEAVVSRFPSAGRIDEGNRFDNNIEIVKRFLKLSNATQIRLSNGEFIETSLFSRKEPLLFVGSRRVPEQVEDFLRGSEIMIGTLVGNDLASHVTGMRRRLKAEGKDFGVLLMLGKSNVEEGGGEAVIEMLDMFPIPSFEANLTIEKIIYNQVLSQIEVTIKNNNGLKVFFLTTLDVNNKTFGDEEIQFIDGSKRKTLVYGYSFPGELYGDAVLIYGEEEGALEKQETVEFGPMDVVDIDDRSEISILRAEYDRLNKAVRVFVENKGDVPAYVDVELIGLVVDGERTAVSGRAPVRVDPGKIRGIPVRVKLSQLDLEENAEVRIRAYYGQRQDSLFKIVKGAYPLSLRSYALYGAGIAALVAIVILIVFASLRKRKR